MQNRKPMSQQRYLCNRFGKPSRPSKRAENVMLDPVCRSAEYTVLPLWLVPAGRSGRKAPATRWPGLLALLTLLGLGGLFASSAQAAGQQIFDGPNGKVRAIAAGADGTTYVGGDFTNWGPQTGGGAALAVSNGAVNRTLPPVAGQVNAVAADGVGGWYIGGDFTAVAGQIRNNIAHIFGTGELDPDFNPNAGGIIHALAVSGATVYVGGAFTTINGSTARSRLAALDATTGAVSPWNPGASGTVYVLAISGGTVYAGGVFSTLGGAARNRLAAVDAGTGLVNGWDPNAGSAVEALIVSGDTVYVGGSFTTINGATTRNRLAAVDAATGAVTDWNPNANSTVFALALSGNKVYAGGGFSEINGTATRNRLAALDAATGSVTAWNPSASGIVQALAVSGNTVYAGGAFDSFGGVTRNRLAAVDVNGNLTAWNPGASSYVNALAVSGSTLYAGGTFQKIGAADRFKLAAFDTSTGGLTGWNPNPNGTVNVLAVSGGTIYAGGEFSSVGGSPSVTRTKLAAFDTNGSLTAWNPVIAGASGVEVYALAVSGNTVYVGGNFNTINGVTRNRLAAIDADTGLATAWDPNAGNAIYALALSGDTVYVGGSFTTINGSTARSRLAAVDATSGIVTAWNPGYSISVNAIAVSGNTVYVGGGCAINGVCLAALDVDTGIASDWNPNPNSAVSALAVSGASVYAGGQFTEIGGTQNGALAGYLARLPLSTRPGAPTSVSVVRGDASGTVSWNAPSNTGSSAIINYVLEVAPGPNYDSWGTATTSGNCLTLTCTVTGLTNGTRYQVRVRGVNANGPGATSLASQWFQPQAHSLNPSVPAGLTATSGNTTLNATWTALNPGEFGSGASTITQYMVYVFTGSTLLKTCRVIGAPAANNCLITGLANGSSYTLKVRAWNNNGKFSNLSGSVGPYTPNP
jgi:hypothetical protein